MKILVHLCRALLLTMPSLVLATPEQDADFSARCSAPGVVRCIGFDSPGDIPVDPTEYTFQPAPTGVYPGAYVPPALDTSIASSGSSSLKFTISSNSGPDTSGVYWVNFSDDFSVQFGQGSPHGNEFYVQWRQRFSPQFLETNYSGADGWKQIIIGEGDRSDENIYSCTDLEIVVQNLGQRGLPQMYHSCGAKNGKYEPLSEPYGDNDFLLQNARRTPPDICLYKDNSGCLFYLADQWMTFQAHVIVGTPYQNDGVYKHDSTIQLWVAAEGEPSTLIFDYRPIDPGCQATQSSIPGCQTGYDLYNNNPQVRRYGQVWLLPYNSKKDSSQSHPEAYVWYDELIISTSRIADPGVAAAAAPMPPTDVTAQ